MSELFSPCTPESRDVTVAIPADFRLASGQDLGGAIQARLVGPQTGSLIVAAGGISADRRAADDAQAPGWWGWTIGDGAPIDTARHRLLTFDWSPQAGSDRLVTISTHDQARLLALVLDHLNLARIDAFVGASYGGCVGLAFSELFPDRIDRLVVVSAAHRAHPVATAWRGIQRRLLFLGLDTGREAETVALARELAMTTYRSPEEFQARFSDSTTPALAGDPYSICDYLIARGQDYAGRVDARRWISLSDALDRHRVTPEAITAATTVVGFSSDRLVPLSDSRELAARLPRLTQLIEAPSLYGHDAFLKERAILAGVLTAALADLPHTCSQEIAA